MVSSLELFPGEHGHPAHLLPWDEPFEILQALSGGFVFLLLFVALGIEHVHAHCVLFPCEDELLHGAGLVADGAAVEKLLAEFLDVFLEFVGILIVFVAGGLGGVDSVGDEDVFVDVDFLPLANVDLLLGFFEVLGLLEELGPAVGLLLAEDEPGGFLVQLGAGDVVDEAGFVGLGAEGYSPHLEIVLIRVAFFVGIVVAVGVFGVFG